MSSQGHAHSTILGSDSPKHAEVIKLYEDLTNFLVPNLKFTPGKHGNLDETLCTCIYTYSTGTMEGDGEDTSKS
jgi:hypothetical protein